MKVFALFAAVTACSAPIASPTSAPTAVATIRPMAARSPLAGDAIAGITDATLAAIVADHWEFMMRWAPTYATTLGDHRYDAVLAPRDEAAIARAAGERDALIARLRAIPAGRLSPSDAVTAALLRETLEANAAADVCRFHEWSIDSGSGSAFGELSYLVEGHIVTTPKDAENLIARMKQGARAVDDTVANLAIGLGAGRVAAAGKVTRAIEQLDTALAQPSADWQMAKPKWTAAPDGADPWPAGERARLAAELVAVVDRELRPAFVRQRAFLHDKLLPHARAVEGLTGLPDGAACYRAAIRGSIAIAKTPDELHALGLAEIARTDREIAALGARALGTHDLASTIAKLRDDHALYFSTREELLAAAQQDLDRAKAAIPKFFAVLPKADCVLREIPAYEAPYTTIAYYRQPNYDGSKPGEFFVNTYKPETRPRYELAALAAHESIPGHHLQIAIAQELGALPLFRKLDGSTAFVEGWALYTERLAGEMGLYTSDLDRLGQLSYDAWRASRLVVDTGIHALGWTRAQAESYMHDHTALTPVNITNEVDRYIGWPGQAVAYKVGQLEILRLRAHAEAALGPRFDLPRFHEVVLGAGAVTLPVLADRVEAWIASQK